MTGVIPPLQGLDYYGLGPSPLARAIGFRPFGPTTPLNFLWGRIKGDFAHTLTSLRETTSIIAYA